MSEIPTSGPPPSPSQRQPVEIEVGVVTAPDETWMVLLQLPDGYAVVPAEAALRIAEELIAAAHQVGVRQP